MMTSNKIYLILIIVICSVLCLSWTPEDGKTKGKEKKSSGSKVEKVMRIKEVEIKGEVKKPQAVFFLPRSKFTMDDMIVTESFIENISNVVDKE